MLKNKHIIFSPLVLSILVNGFSNVQAGNHGISLLCYSPYLSCPVSHCICLFSLLVIYFINALSQHLLWVNKNAHCHWLTSCPHHFIMVSSLFTFFFFFDLEAFRILVPWPEIKPGPPAEVQSLNHWTTKEVPGLSDFNLASY